MADKTEKPTAKRRQQARDEGTVARSQDLNGAAVLLVGLIALGISGPGIAQALANVMRESLGHVASSDIVSPNTIPNLLLSTMVPAIKSLAPVLAACTLAAILINLPQVGLKPRTKALKPNAKRLNPITGAKNLFGPNALVETAKGILKILIVGAVVLSALIPRLPDFAGLVGVSPVDLGSRLAGDIRSIGLRAAFAYILIGLVDYAYQRKRTEKSIKMDKQEVKDEARNAELAPEIKGEIRRRQMSQARARMMADVPTADVVVTNPTHYAVALRYDGDSAAPVVVAKGMDHLAARIRELATEADVPLVPDPPLARSLHKSVEVGQEIPEELFEAVAAVLAHVYRLAGRRRVA